MQDYWRKIPHCQAEKRLQSRQKILEEKGGAGAKAKMPFGSWLKNKAKAMREERDFKSSVKVEAKEVQRRTYRQAYRKRMLRQAATQGQQHAKPRQSGSLLDLLVGSGGQKMPSFDLGMGLLGESTKKQVRHKRKR